jgi:hypothetical protein
VATLRFLSDDLNDEKVTFLDMVLRFTSHIYTLLAISDHSVEEKSKTHDKKQVSATFSRPSLLFWE